jgi:hypothetical protein
MDNKLVEEMINEIDAMTCEEYWILYKEAQKLPDFWPDMEDKIASKTILTTV